MPRARRKNRLRMYIDILFPLFIISKFKTARTSETQTVALHESGASCDGFSIFPCELLPEDEELENLVINCIRTLAMDAVEKAKSGHPGTPMALAPTAFTLFDKFLSHNPENPNWSNRDRFVLSAGHASMLLYAALYVNGYDISIDDIKKFRSLHSRCPGHPELGITAGVETTTGPLGQGVSNSVGMAIAGKWLSEHFNRPATT